MSILELPTIKIASNQFGLQSNSAVTRSTFNNRLTTAQRIGQFWTGTFNFGNNKADSQVIKDIQVWLAKLDGASGRFYAFDPDRRTPAGTGNGTPLVDGEDQSGFELQTKGWDSNETVLLAGDYFEFNGEYKLVTDDVISDGSGLATIQFAPEIRQTPPDEEPLVVNNPKGIFLLTDSSSIWNSNKNKVVDISINFAETFDYKQFLMTQEGDNLVTESSDRIIL